jgi:hypothetical protein
VAATAFDNRGRSFPYRIRNPDGYAAAVIANEFELLIAEHDQRSPKEQD